ncbi:MAG TPA: calcium/sodium antiporter [Spirochaetota bacterium]|nr:calcium/sodium antiporter [Spirochaetota bacterium]HPH01724.1 calcium/sodium antiporter [Spirochaetota bacterium]HPN82314.1 calcium/sodium antiporter [Spirochaetota bacterium]
MLLNILLLLAGIAGLVVSADILVRGASSIARRLSVSDLVVGLTVVAFGTSAPELVVNIVASSEGNGQVVFGNIIGSNIFNILGILGVAGLIRVLAVSKSTAWREIPFVVAGGILLLFLVLDGWHGGENQLSRLDGVVLLVAFTGFFAYVFRMALRGRAETNAGTGYIGEMPLVLAVLAVLGGLIGLFFGGRLVVEQATALARSLGVSDRLIALTIVSAGTSFPELATSAVAAWRGKADIAIGNVVGSNIFNVLFILGVSALIKPVTWNGEADMTIDLGIMIASSLLLFGAMYTFGRRKLDRIEAGIFLVGMLAYTLWVIERG